MSNSRTFQDFPGYFFEFPGLLHPNFQDFSRTFQEIPGLFQDYRTFDKPCEQNLFSLK
jgi:hypothetical protein